MFSMSNKMMSHHYCNLNPKMTWHHFIERTNMHDKFMWYLTKNIDGGAMMLIEYNFWGGKIQNFETLECKIQTPPQKKKSFSGVVCTLAKKLIAQSSIVTLIYLWS